MFRRNSTESPLLRLPYEIRTRIWKLVLGERVMHIRLELRRGITGAEACGTTGRVATRGKSRKSVDEDKVLRGSECACPVTERELFMRYMKILRVLVDLDAEEEKELEAGAENMSEISWGLDFGTLESPDVDVLENFDFDSFLNADGQQLLNPIDGGVPGTDDTVSICLGRFFALKDETPAARQKSTLKSLLREHPHALCNHVFRGKNYEPLPQPALYLLRSCRQVYGETNTIFWSSNTFSFSCSVDFSHFMQFHSNFTKGMITKLHFDIRSQTMLLRWYRAFKMKGVVSSFQNLKFLHLHFDADCWRLDDSLVDELAVTFAPFRALGLKDVTVVIAWYGLRLSRCGPENDHVKLVERLRSVLMGQVNMAEM